MRHVAERSVILDKQGELLYTRFLARMPEHKKKTLKSQLLMQIEQVKKLRPELEMIKVADGARDNWTFFSDEIKDGECVLDFYHASTHLYNAMELIYGKNTVEAITEHKKYRHILRHDEKGVDKIINHLKYQLKKIQRKKSSKLKSPTSHEIKNVANMRDWPIKINRSDQGL
ncbi:MAG: hypothetical protein Q9M92_08930 [Enterobacterales bacterium]|nr:hypothetical protein [Enterobacterales bacterium]